MRLALEIVLLVVLPYGTAENLARKLGERYWAGKMCLPPGVSRRLLG